MLPVISPEWPVHWSFRSGIGPLALSLTLDKLPTGAADEGNRGAVAVGLNGGHGVGSGF